MPTKTPAPYIHVRPTAGLVEALDRLSAAWAGRSPTGKPLSRSDVVRVLIRDAIAVLDAGQANGKRPTKKSQESSR
jgi:hypothetical protein